jgi:hypothetical protein
VIGPAHVIVGTGTITVDLGARVTPLRVVTERSGPTGVLDIVALQRRRVVRRRSRVSASSRAEGKPSSASPGFSCPNIEVLP